MYLVLSHPIFISCSTHSQVKVTMSAFCRHHSVLIQPSSTPNTGLNFRKNWWNLLTVLPFTFLSSGTSFFPCFFFGYIFQLMPFNKILRHYLLFLCTEDLFFLGTVHVQLHLNSWEERTGWHVWPFWFGRRFGWGL